MELPSGLWAIDAVAPVAAVLRPDEPPRLVSWAQLPPARTAEGWPPSRVLGDGECLWVQNELGGPAAQVGPDGVRSHAWTEGLWLAATGPGVAWFTDPPPEQEIVHGSQVQLAPHDGLGQLLRVDVDGRRDRLLVEAPVHGVYAGTDALFVRAESGGHTLRPLGADSYEVERTTRWLELPWDAPLPEVLSAIDHAASCEPPESWIDGGRLSSPWHDMEDAAVQSHGLSWRAGWAAESPGSSRLAIATARAADGSLVGTWDLGVGQVRSLVPHLDGVALAMDRSGDAEAGRPGEVLALSPSAGRPRTLLAEPLDISALVPLTRPVDADSYLAAMLARYPVPDLTGVDDADARLVGEWPDTVLEWTFTHPSRAGLVLRRRLRLFDPLGRIQEPEYCDVHLMEDLDTGELPPPDRARGAILDI